MRRPPYRPFHGVLARSPIIDNLQNLAPGFSAKLSWDSVARQLKALTNLCARDISVDAEEILGLNVE